VNVVNSEQELGVKLDLIDECEIELDTNRQHIWSDMFKGFQCANNILWKPEYTDVETPKYLKIFEEQLRRDSGLNSEEMNKELKKLGLLFLRETVKYENTTARLFHISIPELINITQGLSNEDLILDNSVRGKILKMVSTAYISKYISADKQGGYNALIDVCNQYDIEPEEFLLKVIEFRDDPDAVSVSDMPKFMGMTAKLRELPLVVKVGVSG
jgi:hypothetical protein